MIARLFGIPVYISPYWPIFAVLFVLWLASSSGTGHTSTVARYLVAAAFVLLLQASVLVHELAHCAVARGFGLPVRRVLLFPLGGLSEIEEATSPGREALISGAGPLVSLALAGVGYALATVMHPGLGHRLVALFFVANLVVGIFNLLPGLPLDGGRVFRAGIWKITGRPVTATIAAAWAGRVLAIALLALALTNPSGISLFNLFFYWPWFLVIAVYIWFQSTQAMRAARIRERLPAVSARALARRAIPVLANVPLAEAVRRAQAADARALVIVDHENTPTAIVSEAAVNATPEERRPWIDAGSLARTLSPELVLSANLSGMDLIKAVQQATASEYLLIEPSGQVYGVLAAADLNLAFAGV